MHEVLIFLPAFPTQEYPEAVYGLNIRTNAKHQDRYLYVALATVNCYFFSPIIILLFPVVLISLIFTNPTDSIISLNSVTE